MDEENITADVAAPLRDLAPHMGDAPIATAPAIAAIALSMAMKYHDINTVQDGALYQQYKLEGRNMRPFHLDMVFETAIRMELHLLGASERIAKAIVEALGGPLSDEEQQEVAPPTQSGGAPST